MVKAIPFTGSATAIVTPFDAYGQIDYGVLSELIEYQINNKTDALVVCGTTGESSTLSDAEKACLISFAVKEVGGRIPVIAGTGSNNTRHSMELSKVAEDCGADALLVVTPYYNKTSQAGLIRHFTAVADSVTLPIVMYSVPSRTGMTIAPETCRVLCGHERIVAIKEASSNISAITEIAALCKDELIIYSGNDDQTIPILALGGSGVISVFSNIMPLASHRLCSLWKSGMYSSALSIQLEYLELMNALFMDVNPIPVKEALRLMGFSVGNCRMPLCQMSHSQSIVLNTVMRKYDLIR